MLLQVLPYCDEIIVLLLENLGDPSIHRSVKPQILSVFGDIALSVGPDFAKYFDIVMQMLLQVNTRYCFIIFLRTKIITLCFTLNVTGKQCSGRS